MDAVKAWEYVTRGHVLDVSISASGEYIVAGSQDAYLYMFDKTGRALWGQNLGTPVLRARISPNGEYIATSTYDNILSFFSRTGALLWRRRVNRPVMGIDMTLDGNFVGFYSFLLALENQPRIMRIGKMELRTEEKNLDGNVSADFELSIFFEKKTKEKPWPNRTST